MHAKWILFPIIAATVILSCITAIAQQSDVEIPWEAKWPREIKLPKATIVIYQPQLESFKGDNIQGRFAASVQTPDMEEPVFGAVWVDARVETDRDERIVRLVSIETVRSRFPNAKPEEEEKLAKRLKENIPLWDLSFSLDQLLAGLQTIEQRRVTEQKFEKKPPKIIYVDYPAMLVMVDGKPILEPIEKSSLMTVVNTPFPMVFRKEDKTYYLMGNDVWYRAKEVSSTWAEVASPPKDVAAIRPKDKDAAVSSSGDGTKMAIIVATEPTELISTDGKPRLTPFTGNELMYVENTSSNILYEVDTGRYFLLISGRWYRSKKIEGPWAYVLPENLPKSFANIPQNSEKADLRASVPGTVESKEAVLDAQVPQTAVINRSEAKLEVTYDGDPRFDRITGTEIDYALNTPTPVIRVEGKYYAVDNGVWFLASGPKGPWVVADSVPKSVQDIPPSSPVYNVKYVYIYDSTPEVVYVGYTPGYTGCYVYHGTVIYGTGYYYHPWYHHYYYPRPATWGCSIRYSSYYGWCFGPSFYYGPVTIHFRYSWGHSHYRGWWGPPRYRPPYYRPPHHRPPHHRPPGSKPPGSRPPGGKPPGDRPPGSRPPGGERPTTLPSDNNLYDKRPDKAARDTIRPSTREGKDARPAMQPATRPNNIFTDKDGRVYRRTEKGWEQRQGNKWTRPEGSRPSRPTTRPATPSQLPSTKVGQPTTRPAQPAGKPAVAPAKRPSTPKQRPSSGGSWDRRRNSLQRDSNSRNRGRQRTQQYQRSRQSRSSRPAARPASRPARGRSRR